MGFTTHFELHFQATRLQSSTYRRRCTSAQALHLLRDPQSRGIRNVTGAGEHRLYATGPADEAPEDLALGFSLFTRRY